MTQYVFVNRGCKLKCVKQCNKKTADFIDLR